MTADRRSRPVSRFAETVVGRLLFRHVPVRAELVAALRGDAAALPAPAPEVTGLWDGLRRELRECLRTGDPATFLRWPPVQQTMVIRSHRRVAQALAHLRARHDWRTRWRPALREITLGLPRPLPRCPWSSANAVFQAFHLCRFEEATERSLASMPFIVEFGGGYGWLCQMLHRLGFTGTYVIFDLPEVAALQRFYLRHVGIATSAAGPVAPLRGGVTTVTDEADLRALLSARPPGDAAFVAIGSLSEAPLPLRDRLLAEVEAFDAFAVFYSAAHDGVDNRAYFAGWRSRLTGHDWSDVEVPAFGKSAAYLFGRRHARPESVG